MRNPVVNMLHAWRQRLNEVVPDTRDGVLQLLGLPDPLDLVALQALGIARLEIDSYVSSVTVRFLEPLLFADVVAVFGAWTGGVRGPGNIHESPRCYHVGGLFSSRFTFHVQAELVRDEANSGELQRLEHCDRVQIALHRYTPLPDGARVPVGRIRAWWNRIWYEEKDRTTILPSPPQRPRYGGAMRNPVVNMLHAWRQRLNEVVPDTRDGVLQLLGLPDPLDLVALQALGIARLEIDSYVSSVTVRFLEPLLFADVVAVFGAWTDGVRGPENIHESPRWYDVGGLFSAQFTFYVKAELVRNETISGEAQRLEHCDRLFIALYHYTSLLVGAPVPVSRIRAWWNRLWREKKS